MQWSSEQRFFYSRIALIFFFAGGIASAVAGTNGLSLGYGSLAVCLWGFLGILNLRKRSSFWLLLNRPVVFSLFLASLAGLFILADRFGLSFHLWFYPADYRLSWLINYWITSLFTSLVSLEFLYFLTGFFGDGMKFDNQPDTFWHKFLDAGEQVLLLSVIGAMVAGVLQWYMFPLTLLIALIALWAISFFSRLYFQIPRWEHYALMVPVIFLAGMLGMLLQRIHVHQTRSWVYLGETILNGILFGLPMWMWLGGALSFFVTLRLWLFIAVFVVSRFRQFLR